MKFSHTGYLGFEENRKDQPAFKEIMGENILHEEGCGVHCPHSRVGSTLELSGLRTVFPV